MIRYDDVMRDLAWDGYINARSLGGLPTDLSRDGLTVHGRIARGPRRERLTSVGWDEARRWGLRTVVDLRCPYEIGAREGDPSVDVKSLVDVSVVNAPTEDQDDPEFRQTCFPILDSPEYWRHNWRLQPHLVRSALDAIASAKPGVLVHCSAGRDRTGMISALLLGNAGVAPDAVAEDYVASVRAMAGVASHAPTEDRQAGWSRAEVDVWLRDKLTVVRDAVKDVQDVLDTLEVPTVTRQSLRAMLVGP